MDAMAAKLKMTCYWMMNWPPIPLVPIQLRFAERPYPYHVLLQLVCRAPQFPNGVQEGSQGNLSRLRRLRYISRQPLVTSRGRRQRQRRISSKGKYTGCFLLALE